MAKAPQLVAVVLALVLVMGAAVYGIVQGATSDPEASSTTETTWRSAPPCRSRTARLPVLDSLTLPTHLPEGVCLSSAYYDETAPGTLWYDNQQQDKVLLVGFFPIGSLPSSGPTGSTPIQLGNLVGYVKDTEEPGGTRSYYISFDKDCWTYSVFGRIGKNGMLPDNQITPDELNAVAQSIAVQ